MKPKDPTDILAEFQRGLYEAFWRAMDEAKTSPPLKLVVSNSLPPDAALLVGPPEQERPRLVLIKNIAVRDVPSTIHLRTPKDI